LAVRRCGSLSQVSPDRIQAHQRLESNKGGEFQNMEWPRLLAYITERVDKELLVRNEYLAAENRILRAKISRLELLDGEKRTLAEIAHRLGRKALAEVAVAAKPDTMLPPGNSALQRTTQWSTAILRGPSSMNTGSDYYFDGTPNLAERQRAPEPG
jgi:hypothetical protein